jgi:hypothetical protein
LTAAVRVVRNVSRSKPEFIRRRFRKSHFPAQAILATGRSWLAEMEELQTLKTAAG